MAEPHDIRIATIKDIESIQGLLRLSWHKAYDSHLGHDKVSELIQLWHSSSRLEEDIAKSNCQFLVLCIKAEILATAFINKQGKDVILSRMYVHPEWQNKGLGTKLMTKIMASLSKETCVSLTVEPQNTSAIQFYQNFGFKILGPGSCSEDAHDDIPTLIMERPAKI